jgi:hypothetical protein
MGQDGGGDFFAAMKRTGYAAACSGCTLETYGMEASGTWFFWALMSAGFAALTAVFAKMPIEALYGVPSERTKHLWPHFEPKPESK